MQSSCLLGPRPSTTPATTAGEAGVVGVYVGHVGLGLSLSSRRPIPFVGLWAWAHARSRRPSAPPNAAAGGCGGGEQDHYAVLGISRSATAAEVKRAYRLLALKYHPDVSGDSQAGEMFKSIRNAYEVLSNEDMRAQYDMSAERPSNPQWNNDIDSDEWRYRSWSEIKKKMYDRRREKYKSWYDRADYDQETSSNDRGSFSEVLSFAFITFFFIQTIGCRAALIICSLPALLDKKLDIGYKSGYVIAWFLGGQGGVLLMLLMHFAIWLCGKNSSGLVAAVVVAMWVGANVARFAPLPQGAVLTLLYMSIKLQSDLK